ncbi:hypothetical protein SM124_19230 [Bacillus sp. 31A1R]|uniref:Arsenate reductase n=1 Tax=Robertmurraya mangrovi TaxID=3098077 RepID=A0ABU5J353_9BACI|nr:hypothetical protein [Bacillus sp. 31A1R]MDZ5473856.1 hypothetical protein [Bacillus sp. 31A1R]
MEKKTLILTTVHENVESLINRMKLERKIIITLENFQGLMIEPYGRTMRNIILTVHLESIDEILIVLNDQSSEITNNQTCILELMKRNGISDHTLQTLEYIGHHPKSWLQDSMDLNKALIQNLKIVRDHPLLPKHVKVDGFIWDDQILENLALR